MTNYDPHDVKRVNRPVPPKVNPLDLIPDPTPGKYVHLVSMSDQHLEWVELPLPGSINAP